MDSIVNAMNRIKRQEEEYVEKKLDYFERDFDLTINTDFKELGMTNQKMRDLYVATKLREAKKELDFLEIAINHNKRIYRTMLALLENEQPFPPELLGI